MNTPSNAADSDGRNTESHSTSSIADTINSAFNEVADESGAALSEIQSQLHSTASAVGERISKTGARLGAQLSTAKQSIGKVAGSVSDRARVTATATNSYIHDNPWQAIGISTVVGLLIGLVLARRR